MSKDLDRQVRAIVDREIGMQRALIEEKAEAIPPEDRGLYEIRIRVHRSGWRTESLVLKSAPKLPCPADCYHCNNYPPGLLAEG